MKKLIVVAFVLCFALGAFADDTMNTGADQGATTTQTTETHHHHKKHEKKMKKMHHKKHQEAAPAESTGGANTGAPAGAQ